MILGALEGYSLGDIQFVSQQTIIRKATRDADGKPVIVKAINAEYPTQLQISRLAWGYESLKRFNHPGIATPVDYVESVPALVIEDIGGIELGRYLGNLQGSPFDVKCFLDIAIQIADALGEIHSAQVIHKDLHPGNIIIEPETLHVQIIDFSLSSLLPREQQSFIAPDHLTGVLTYLSPEMTGRMNRAVDYRTDFYSLGIIFYEVLSGVLPFTGDDALEIIHSHIAKTATNLTNLRADIPPALNAVIQKLLAKNAEDRYQNALGLKYDLKAILKGMTKGDLSGFKLGAGDLTDRFQTPQKLYGREIEAGQLRNAYLRAFKGGCEFVSVSGYSGIGKSSLVHEVYKPIAEKGGFFLHGKFDQLERHIPYNALKKAFQHWVDAVLAKGPAQLEPLKADMGDNFSVLTEFLPDLAPISGKLVSAPELGPIESKNRFNRVLHQFIEHITEDNPLVLFIDDIQWADMGTLGLLQYLSENVADLRLLIVLAYRDNEVGPAHPAQQLLEKITTNPATLTHINLSPLTREAITQLLVDSLLTGTEKVAPLAALIEQKTTGNPFFINEFLKTLYVEQLLQFDLSARCWQWDIQSISALNVSDNVVDLMLGKMKSLPEHTHYLLRLAACFGSQVDLKTLSLIANQALDEVVSGLWPALEQGLLVQDGGEWLPGVLGATAKANNAEPVYKDIPLSPKCRFSHDRMLQAAYASMNQAEKTKTHLAIGRLLKIELSSEDNKALFTVVSQLNSGRFLMKETNEIQELINLNLRAAAIAKAACVWSAASNYAQTGISLLASESWEEHYEVTLSLYLIRLECESLDGEKEVADALFSLLMDKARRNIEKAQVCVVRMQQYMRAADFKNSISVCIEALRYCEIHVPIEDGQLFEQVNALDQELNQYFQSNGSELILTLPEIRDGLIKVALYSLANLGNMAGAWEKDRLQAWCYLYAIKLTLKHGIGNVTALSFSGYSYFLAKKRRYDKALEFSDASIQLLDVFPSSIEPANVCLLIGACVLPFCRPLKHSVEMLSRGYKAGLESGEVARAVYNVNYREQAHFLRGETLSFLESHNTMLSELDKVHKLFHPFTFFSEKLIHTLKGNYDSLNPASFSGAVVQAISQGVYKSFHDHFSIQQSFWCGEFQQVIQKSETVYGCLESSIYHVLRMEFYFISGISHYLSVFESGIALKDEILESCEYELTILAQSVEETYQPRLDLLLALKKQYAEAGLEETLSFYESAISGFEKAGAVQYLALANELLGRYWLVKGREVYAESHIKNAYYLYEKWGGVVKTIALEAEFPTLFSTASDNSSLPVETSNGSTGIDKDKLNLASIIKSSQAISSELILDKLTHSIMRIIVESAGAQAGAMILKEGREIQLEVTLNMGEVNSQNEALSKQDIPTELVEYVYNSRSELVIGDMAKEPKWQVDPYFKKNNVLSVLCMPIYYRDHLTGVLYLENRLATDVFTASRLEVLKMLLTQATISLENAHLYDEVQALNVGLEAKVEQRTEELKSANRELEAANRELQSFSYSVSHDLKAPLRSIKGFSLAIKEDYGDTLNQETIKMLDRVLQNGDKMSDLIDGLLELSRTTRAKLEKEDLDLVDLVSDVVVSFQEYKDAELILPASAPAFADKKLMISVLQNLFSNAYKYSSKKEKPRIEFGMNTGPETDTSIFFVKDNGAGFNMKFYDSLFKSFERLHPENDFSGTGVGLATVQRIIHRHGGEIWAESEEGKGATFFFTVSESGSTI